MSVKQPPVPNWVKETISNLELSSLGKTSQGNYLNHILKLRDEANCYNLIIDLQLLVSFLTEGRVVGFEFTPEGLRLAKEAGLELNEHDCLVVDKLSINNLELLTPQTSSINEVINKGGIALELPDGDEEVNKFFIKLTNLTNLFVLDEEGNEYSISSMSGSAIHTLMYNHRSIGKTTDTVLH